MHVIYKDNDKSDRNGRLMNMEIKVTQDNLGTHVDWKHDGITPKMLDWFWSNMEKMYVLWHPKTHGTLTWPKPPVHGNPVESIHRAPHHYPDGVKQDIYIRIEDLTEVPGEIKDYIIYEHCVVVAGLGLGPESIETGEPMGYRIHQWEKTDYGVVGKSSAFGAKIKETKEDGLKWAEHCVEEIENWKMFLSQMYDLFKSVANTDTNPFADLTVEGEGRNAKYKYIGG